MQEWAAVHLIHEHLLGLNGNILPNQFAHSDMQSLSASLEIFCSLGFCIDACLSSKGWA